MPQKDATPSLPPSKSVQVQPTPAPKTAPLPSATGTDFPMGNMEVTLNLNGSVHAASSEAVSLSREEWPNQKLRLHIVNRGNIPWEKPQLRTVISDNWGQSQSREIVLSTLVPGSSADFLIPTENFLPTDKESVSIWVQLYLGKTDVPVNESYWCVIFELRD